MLTIAVALLIAVSQPVSASVSGTVRDASSREPLVGATIALQSSRREIVTSADGRFLVTSVGAGAQTFTVRCIGHATRTIDVIVPSHGALSVDIALDPVAVRLAPVSITDYRATSHTPAQPGATSAYRDVTPDALRRHPLLSEPDVLRAISGGDVFMRPETAGGLFVRGGRADQIAYSLDGVPILNAAHLGGLLGAWNTDALAGAQLSVTAEGVDAAAALSGALHAHTLTSSDTATLRTAISSTQLRITSAGPLLASRASYLVSVRQAVPTLGATADPNLLRGESGDVMARVTTPFARGTLALLAYTSSDEFTSSRVVAPVSSTAARNGFEWGARSVGVSWSRAYTNAVVRATAWQASSRALADWNTEASDTHLSSQRTDYGAQLERSTTSLRGGSTLAVRIERVHTAYSVVGRDSGSAIDAGLHAQLPMVTFSAARSVTLSHNLSAEFGSAVLVRQSEGVFAPHVHVQWLPSSRFSMSTDVARAVQPVQSLQNSESVVSHTFPAALPVLASRGQVPIAEGDQVSLAAKWHLRRGLSLAVVGYAREMRDVLMVAERGERPFAVLAGNNANSANAASFTNAENTKNSSALAAGHATARGASADLRFTTDRISALLMYSAQRVRYRSDGVTYAPEFVAPHQLDGGLTVEASRGLSFRIGGTAAVGRHATASRGAVEWDGCNLADRACEFAGTPAASPNALGALTLPGYVRLDVGARKTWRRVIRNRENVVTAYGTLTNLFNRTNYLTRFERDGVLSGVEMRSRTPLVVGMEWRY
jgi:CarboxypepD_reg-like domain